MSCRFRAQGTLPQHTFHKLGVDVMVDETLTPYVIDVNTRQVKKPAFFFWCTPHWCCQLPMREETNYRPLLYALKAGPRCLQLPANRREEVGALERLPLVRPPRSALPQSGALYSPSRPVRASRVASLRDGCVVDGAAPSLRRRATPSCCAAVGCWRRCWRYPALLWTTRLG